MVTLEQFGNYAAGYSHDPISGGDREEIAQLCLDSALALITTTYDVERVPTEILDLATLQVASDLWARKDTTGGILPAAFDGAVSARLSRDSLASVRSMLASWRILVIG